MNKKGGNIFTIIILGVALVLIGAIAFIGVVGGSIFANTWNTVTNSLTSIPTVNGTANISSAASTGFGNINLGLQQLSWISFLFIFGLILGIFILYFSVQAHPALFFVHIIITAAGVMFSIFISRAYETLLNSGGVVGSSLQSYTGSSYILLYLPLWTTIVGFIGAIILYSNITKDSAYGGIS